MSARYLEKYLSLGLETGVADWILLRVKNDCSTSEQILSEFFSTDHSVLGSLGHAYHWEHSVLQTHFLDTFASVLFKCRHKLTFDPDY